MLGRMISTWPRVIAGMGLLGLFLGLSWVTGLAERPILSEELASPQGKIILALALLIVVFGCVALPTWTLAVLAPGMLGLVDLFLMTFLFGIPATLALAAMGAPGWVYCAVLAAIYLVAHQIFYGRWLSGFAARDTGTRRDRFVVPEPLETVWARLAPLPEHEGRYYWPKATFEDAPKGSDADFVIHAPRRRGLKDADELIWIETLEPGRTLVLRAEPLPRTFGVKERRALRLSEVDGQTRIDLETTFLEVSVFHRIRLWLNNDAREFAVSQKYRAMGRKDRSILGRQVLPA